MEYNFLISFFISPYVYTHKTILTPHLQLTPPPLTRILWPIPVSGLKMEIMIRILVPFLPFKLIFNKILIEETFKWRLVYMYVNTFNRKKKSNRFGTIRWVLFFKGQTKSDCRPITLGRDTLQ